MCALLIFAAQPILAAEIAWQPQNGSTDISDPRNWAGGVLPGNGDLKKFGDYDLFFRVGNYNLF
jgi:hypothetical protein